MRICRLDLLAYGPFTHQTLSFGDGPGGVALVYGENEAGKSAALRAISGWLFGIGAKTPDDFVHAYKKLLIGEKLTRGLGAGNMPEVGKDAMVESADMIERLVAGTDIVFITAGMGGGTGTGAAPVVAEIAKERGAIVVGVITMPFRHEKGRLDYAREGLNKIRKATHTTVIIDNNKLMDLVPQLPINTAFTFADSILANMVKGIVETIALPSLINLDFADFRTIMTKGDVAIVGMGQSNGPDRAEEPLVARSSALPA